jgi:hypothetical protein
MNFCKIWLIVVLLGGGVGCVKATAQEGRLTDERNKENLLRYLRPALRSAGGIGRLYYSTACSAKDGYPIPFPRVELQLPSKRKGGLAAVREIFGTNKEVVVTQDRSGMIRIIIGNPTTEILSTRIRALTLEPLEQYNPNMAIDAIAGSKEVEAAMRKLGVKLPAAITDMNVVTPEPGLPHLPSSLNNMTMDQMFDLVAKTFGGITSYGSCADPSGVRLFYVDYFEVLGHEGSTPSKSAAPQ